MNEITKTITVDLYRRGSVRLIFARQNDAFSRSLRIKLTASGEAYPVPAETVATVSVLRPDGVGAAFAAEVCEDGDVLITLPHWSLGVAGETRCAVVLVDGEGKKLTSDDFLLDVRESLYEGEDVSEDESYSLLTDLLAEVSAYKGDELARAEAERERVAEEAARNDAEEIRAYAENVRATAESQRSREETRRIENEKKRISDEAARETAEAERRNSEQARFSAEADRVNAENTRKTAEADRVKAEQGRALAEVGRNEIVANLVDRIDGVYDCGGRVTLEVSVFDDEKTATLQIDGLGENDAILFTPATVMDRNRIQDAGLFVSPITVGGAVTVSVTKLPVSNVTMVYFITRGSST